MTDSTAPAEKIPKKGPKSAPRVAAFKTLNAILLEGTSLDDALAPARKPLKDSRDKALHRQLVMTVLRHHGELTALIESFVERMPKGRAEGVLTILKVGMAQILFLNIPSYAAVSTTVDLAKRSGFSGHAGMVNAVMRRTTREGVERLGKMDRIALNTPAWLMTSWSKAYGDETARAMATASLEEPALDLTVKSDPEHWAGVLEGEVLPNGSVRVRQSGAVETLPGYGEGAWWVQDAAATLPATLLGNVKGKRVADICAAPGGKTAQLANVGAEVVAVDRSADRMKRLKENLKRLDLPAETVIADAARWRPDEKFDAILLDAPCTATGTLRRHPDIGLGKSGKDVESIVPVQERILDNMVRCLSPGGVLVYCTCSLQPEEGPEQVHAFLSRHDNMTLSPIVPADIFGLADVVTPEGCLRTQPNQLAEQGGWDGFFAARFAKA